MCGGKQTLTEHHDDHHDPADRNTEWGYFGHISRIETSHAADPTKAWDIASRRIAEVTGASPEGVRDFLDSAMAATSPTTA